MLTFETMYTENAGAVYRFCLGLSGSRETAEDITSETFIRAWSRRDTIRTVTLKAYLFRIARNLFLEQCRKGARTADMPDQFADGMPTPEAAAHTRLQLDRALKTLASFPEAERSIFLLRVRQQLSYDEIARVMDLSLSVVKITIHRVRKKLVERCLDRKDPS